MRHNLRRLQRYGGQCSACNSLQAAYMQARFPRAECTWQQDDCYEHVC